MRPQPGPVERKFAYAAQTIVYAGLLLMIVAFVLYAADTVPSRVPLSEVPETWHLSAAERLDDAGRSSSWSWLSQLPDAGSIALAALVFFPTATIVLVLVTAAWFARARDGRYAVISALLGLVLIFAAAGVV